MRRPHSAHPEVDRPASPVPVPVPPEVITVAVRWYLRHGLSYRDVEELLAERGIEVDRVTVYRWVQRFTTHFIDAARLCRRASGIGGSSTRPTPGSRPVAVPLPRR
jgi:hypothetical protein